MTKTEIDQHFAAGAAIVKFFGTSTSEADVETALRATYPATEAGIDAMFAALNGTADALNIGEEAPEPWTPALPRG